MAEQETVGSGYLYSAKPFNVLNPSGIAPEQAVEVFNQQTMQNRQHAFQAQEADKDREVQSIEKQKDREHDSLQGDKQLAAQQTLEKQRMEQEAAQAEQNRVFEAGENEKTREIQREQLKQQQESDSRRMRFEENQLLHNQTMEKYAIERQQLEDQRHNDASFIDDEAQLEQLQLKGESGAREQRITEEMAKNNQRLVAVQTAHALVSAGGPAEQIELSKKIMDAFEAKTSIFKKLDPEFDAIRKKIMDASSIGDSSGEVPWYMNEEGVPGAAAIAKKILGITTPAPIEVAAQEIGALLAPVLVTSDTPANIGDGSVSTTQQMQDKISGMVKMLGAAATAKTSEERNKNLRYAGDVYVELQGMGINTSVLDHAMTLLGDFQGSAGDVQKGVNAKIAVESANQGVPYVPSDDPKLKNSDQFSETLRMYGKMTDKEGKFIAANFRDGELKYRAVGTTPDGRPIYHTRNEINQKVLETLVMVNHKTMTSPQVSRVLDDMTDGKADTLPEFEAMLNELPPEVSKFVVEHVRTKRQELQAYVKMKIVTGDADASSFFDDGSGFGFTSSVGDLMRNKEDLEQRRDAELRGRNEQSTAIEGRKIERKREVMKRGVRDDALDEMLDGGV